MVSVSVILFEAGASDFVSHTFDLNTCCMYSGFTESCKKNFTIRGLSIKLTEHAQLLNLGRNCALSMLSDSLRFFAICKIE